MTDRNDKLTVTIDGVRVETNAGQTILDTARRHGIYIPTLCAHKDLTPFGACRMCVVEVKGMRGYPAACTTPVTEGMEIQTKSPAIEAARLDILKLILSEHPSSCLICDERVECRAQMGTIRKAGVTTGCRYCPSDGQCELQTVVERLGVDELDFPVTYRGLEVKKSNPFIERDYNLCILCGR
ncbi:MAG: 2Fe-2S iron-sulfur cluster-binding protein, partial [bacterium]